MYRYIGTKLGINFLFMQQKGNKKGRELRSCLPLLFNLNLNYEKIECFCVANIRILDETSGSCFRKVFADYDFLTQGWLFFHISAESRIFVRNWKTEKKNETNFCPLCPSALCDVETHRVGLQPGVRLLLLPGEGEPL